MSSTEPPVVRVQRVIAASPETVYDEWLDPEALRDWMCPRPARATAVDVDPRVGGRLRIDIEDSGDRLYVTGRYLELDRPRLLAFTWWCSAWTDRRDSLVTVTFEPHLQGHTLMTIHHARLPDDVRPEHEKGWHLIAAQLEESLNRRRR